MAFLFLRKSRQRRPADRKPSFVPRLETLEDRTLLTNYTAATVSDLIADIKASNQQGGSNTITLVAPTTSPYILTAVDNSTDGNTGLPVIAAKNNLTIVGNGDTIERATAAGTPDFRLFDVAVGASLTLQNLTLQNGLAYGYGGSFAEGGAVYNQGTLDLNGVIVQNNMARGGDGFGNINGSSAAGGGIYSKGVLTLEGNTLVQNNEALGGHGRAANYSGGPNPGAGGNGLGGGLYVAGGTVTLSNATLSSNVAQGGQGGRGLPAFSSTGGPGGNGGNGLGAGLYAAGGTITLHQDTVTGNSAAGGIGGPGGSPHGKAGSAGLGEGGGLFIEHAALVCLDSFTHAHVNNNHASTNSPDIHGKWKRC